MSVEVDPARLAHAATGLEDIVRVDYERAAAALRRGFPSSHRAWEQHPRRRRGPLQRGRRVPRARRRPPRGRGRGRRDRRRAPHDPAQPRPRRVGPRGHARCRATGHDAARRLRRPVRGRGPGPARVGPADLGASPVGVRLANQEDFLRISFATAGLAPSLLPTPVAVSGLVTNLESIQAAADDLAAVAATLQTEANARFDQFATEATVGWTDLSVDGYRAVVDSLKPGARAGPADHRRDGGDAAVGARPARGVLDRVHHVHWPVLRHRASGAHIPTGHRDRERRVATRHTRLGRGARWLAAQRAVLAAVSGAITQLDGMITDVPPAAARPPPGPTSSGSPSPGHR